MVEHSNVTKSFCQFSSPPHSKPNIDKTIFLTTLSSVPPEIPNVFQGTLLPHALPELFVHSLADAPALLVVMTSHRSFGMLKAFPAAFGELAQLDGSRETD